MRDYMNCFFISVQNIHHLGSVPFLKIAHVGLIRCAKYILQTKHMDLYIENNFSLL